MSASNTAPVQEAAGLSAAITIEPEQHPEEAAASRPLARRAFDCVLSVPAWLAERRRSVYGLAVARYILGIAALATLLANLPFRYALWGSGAAWMNEYYADNAFTSRWLFSAFEDAQSDSQFTALYVLLIALTVCFTIGLKFRIVTPVMWALYVGLLFMNKPVIGEVGDVAWRIAVMLLWFTDASQVWSVDAMLRRRFARMWPAYAPQGGGLISQCFGRSETLGRTRKPVQMLIDGLAHSMPWFTGWQRATIHNLALATLIVQICWIYFSAGTYKTGEAWVDGTAVYYATQLTEFHTFPWLNGLLGSSAIIVALLTFGSVLVQLFFPALIIHPYSRAVALAGILAFHLGIGILMNILWFSLAMVAVDAALVDDRTYRKLAEKCRALFRRQRA